MPRFRKRPVEIEAEQFRTGCPLPFRDRGAIVCFDGDEWFVETVHGQRVVLADGDWVTLEPRGVHQAYPCKPDIFEASYEPVDEELRDAAAIKLRGRALLAELRNLVLGSEVNDGHGR